MAHEANLDWCHQHWLVCRRALTTTSQRVSTAISLFVHKRMKTNVVRKGDTAARALGALNRTSSARTWAIVEESRSPLVCMAGFDTAFRKNSASGGDSRAFVGTHHIRARILTSSLIVLILGVGCRNPAARLDSAGSRVDLIGPHNLQAPQVDRATLPAGIAGIAYHQRLPSRLRNGHQP